jgi:hypothetical protein
LLVENAEIIDKFVGNFFCFLILLQLTLKSGYHINSSVRVKKTMKSFQIKIGKLYFFKTDFSNERSNLVYELGIGLTFNKLRRTHGVPDLRHNQELSQKALSCPHKIVSILQNRNEKRMGVKLTGP